MLRRSIARLAVVLSLSVSLSLTAGCPSRRESLNREALLQSIGPKGGAPTESLPTLDAMRALKAPAPPVGPPPDLVGGAEATALGEARAAIHLRADRGVWRGALEGAEASGEAALHACLTHVALLEVSAAEAACLAVVDQIPGSVDALGAWAALRSLRSVDAGLDRRLGAAAVARSEGCRGGPLCPEQIWLLGRDAVAAAEVAKDVDAVRAAVGWRGTLTAAHVEGPFMGDALGAFAAEGRGEVLRPRPRRFAATDVEPYRGMVTPASRGEAGLYRVTWGGRVKTRTRARVLLRCTDACRLRIDGELVGERHPALTPGPDVLRFTGSLLPGPHRFEVLTWADGGADAVALAVLDGQGRPLLVADVPAEGRSSFTRAAAWPKPALDGGALSLAALEHDLALGWAEREGFGRTASAVTFSQGDLVRRGGFSPVVLATVAAWWTEDAGLGNDRAAAAVRPLWEALAARWPRHPGALLADATRWLTSDPDEALLRINALLAERPDWRPAHRVRAALAMSRGAFDEGVASAQALAAPEDASEADLLRAIDVMQATGRVEDELSLRSRAVAHARQLWGAERAEHFLAQGLREEAVEAFMALSAAVPGHYGEERLWGLLEVDDPRAALERVGAHLQRFPNDRAAWRRRAEIAAAVEGPVAGRLVAEEAVERFSADRDLRALCIELGADAPWAHRLVEGDAAVDRWLAQSPRPWRGHPVVFVLDVIERHLFADQGQLAVRHYLAELSTEQAVDAYGELPLSSDEQLVRLRVIKPDGSVFEPELVSGVGAVSLPGLAPGDLVELLAVSFADAPAMDDFAFEVRPLEGPAPAAERAYVLTAPQALFDDGIELIQSAGAPAPTLTDDGDRRRADFRLKDVDARRYEPDAVPAEVAVMTVGFKRGVDAEGWARLRGAPLLRQAAPTPWMRAVAQQVAGQGSSVERMWRIWRFVQSRVGRAEAPSDAEEVLDAGRGQRMPLLLALLRGADLDATPIALHVPQWSAPLEIPNAHHFGLLGVRVEHVGEASFIVDGVGAPDALPPAAAGAQVLDLALDRPADAGLLGWFGATGDRLDDLPDDVIAENTPARVALELKAEADALTGFLALNVPRHQAEPLRDAFLAADERQLRAAFEQLLGPTLPGVEVTGLTMPALDRRGEPLGVGVQLRMPVVASAGQAVRFEKLFADGATTALGLFPGLSRYTAVTERHRPLRVSPGHELLEVQITLPEGATFTELPEPASLTAGSASLDVRAEVTGQTLYYRRELKLDAADVDPEAWRRLRPALVALAAAADARLAFLWSGDDAVAAAAVGSPPGVSQGGSDEDRDPDVGR